VTMKWIILSRSTTSDLKRTMLLILQPMQERWVVTIQVNPMILLEERMMSGNKQESAPSREKRKRRNADNKNSLK
jgi:hypothetical protein